MQLGFLGGFGGMSVHLGPKNLQMGVSENGGTPKWMVYNGKPY